MTSKSGVVLAANLNEQVGFRDNRGCRLNDTEIRDRIAGLQANSSMFGPNCVFNWSGNYTVIYDQEIPASRIQSVTAFWLNPNFLLWQNGYWNPDAVNVYFAGNVQAGGNPTGAWAYTLDPGVPGTFVDLPAWIVLNDGGFVEPNGFSQPPLDGDPAVVNGYHILEHEMAHYLGRFNNRSFSATGSQYDGGEHDIATPAPRNNVLRDGGAPGPFPLNVPGSVSQTPSELQEIWDRVLSGQWNLP